MANEPFPLKGKDIRKVTRPFDSFIITDKDECQYYISDEEVVEALKQCNFIAKKARVRYHLRVQDK